MEPEWRNQLYFGDNLDILRRYLADDSVDLVYLDPPFNSNASYNVLFKEKNGTDSAAQIIAFDDFWHWDRQAAATYQELVTQGPPKVSSLVRALHDFLGPNDMLAYLTMMAIRLVELRRVLKSTGSIYLHCDPTASHYLKMVMDAVFGCRAYRNEIIWQRTNARSTAARWPRIHDVLLHYGRTDVVTFHAVRVPGDMSRMPHHLVIGPDGSRYQTFELTGAGRTREGDSGKPWRGFDPGRMGRHWANSHAQMDEWDAEGLIHWPANGGFPRRRGAGPFDAAQRTVVVGDLWTDIDRINQAAKERLGYATQKPEALLERIIKASSNEGDVVLDPFCGCGTTIAVAERLHRRWIGTDITHLAITLMKNRLQDAFGRELSPYRVIGEPQDEQSARALAEENRFQFEIWGLGLVGARPAGDPQKGADRGIDGNLYFFDDSTGKARRCLLQVKSGKVQAPIVHALKGVMEREKAAMAALITLEEPTQPMRTEAAEAGFYQPHALVPPVPRMQILTIRDLLEGKKLELPQAHGAATFQRAPRRQKAPRAKPAQG